MIKIEKDTTQIIITKEESVKLKKELKDLFCLAYTGDFGNCYSNEWLSESFPAISELYSIV